jgi:hypothetical protein
MKAAPTAGTEVTHLTGILSALSAAVMAAASLAQVFFKISERRTRNRHGDGPTNNSGPTGR